MTSNPSHRIDHSLYSGSFNMKRKNCLKKSLTIFHFFLVILFMYELCPYLRRTVPIAVPGQVSCLWSSQYKGFVVKMSQKTLNPKTER